MTTTGSGSQAGLDGPDEPSASVLDPRSSFDLVYSNTQEAAYLGDDAKDAAGAAGSEQKVLDLLATLHTVKWNAPFVPGQWADLVRQVRYQHPGLR